MVKFRKGTKHDSINATINWTNITIYLTFLNKNNEKMNKNPKTNHFTFETLL